MKRMIAIFISLMMSGCATYQPMVDFSTSSAPPGNYQKDLSECQAYAERVSIGGGAVVGAAIGAVLGAAVGYAFHTNVGNVAAFGAGVGGLQGATSSGISQVDVIRRCMQSRGYNVLQ
jgi:outer membrane lipoprotein SlyB